MLTRRQRAVDKLCDLLLVFGVAGAMVAVVAIVIVTGLLLVAKAL